MELINLEQVCSVKVNKKKPYDWLFHDTLRLSNWFIDKLLNREPKIVEVYTTSRFIEMFEDCEYFYINDEFKEYLNSNNLYLDESAKKVYYKPHLTFKLSNNTSYTLWYNSIEELDEEITSLPLENRIIIP
jgi:hypothetical protein